MFESRKLNKEEEVNEVRYINLGVFRFLVREDTALPRATDNG